MRGRFMVDYWQVVSSPHEHSSKPSGENLSGQAGSGLPAFSLLDVWGRNEKTRRSVLKSGEQPSSTVKYPVMYFPLIRIAAGVEKKVSGECARYARDLIFPSEQSTREPFRWYKPHGYETAILVLPSVLN